MEQTHPKYIDDADNVKLMVDEVCSEDGSFDVLFANILIHWNPDKMSKLRDMLIARTPVPLLFEDMELPPVDITEADRAEGAKLRVPQTLKPDSLTDIGAWWAKIFENCFSTIACRERQFRESRQYTANLIRQLTSARAEAIPTRKHD